MTSRQAFIDAILALPDDFVAHAEAQGADDLAELHRLTEPSPVDDLYAVQDELSQ